MERRSFKTGRNGRSLQQPRTFPADVKLTVQEARIFSAMSQKALAEAVGLPLPLIGGVEQGLVAILREQRPLWAEALGLPMEQLIFQD